VEIRLNICMKIDELTKYPSKVNSDYIINYIANFSDREDPYAGELPDYIRQFDTWVLKDIPLSNLTVPDNQYSVPLAKEYSEMNSISSPPIVYDLSNNVILDGYHRVVAAKMRGDTNIKAYVQENS
jgi:hypothetical protein